MVRATVFKYVKEFGAVPENDNIQREEVELPPLKNGEALFEVVFLSIDPYEKLIMAAYGIGKVMAGEQVMRIAESKNPKYPVGREYVISCGWRSHVIFNPDEVNDVEWKPFHLPNFFRPVHPGIKGLSLSLALGAAGMPGATAYIGVVKRLNVQPGKTIVINAASGAVGQVAGQIAKIKGLKVIGAAGSKAKCDYLKSIGFDVAINYKTDNLDEVLSKAAPEGVNYYVDQVGGDFSTCVIGSHVARNGKAVIIGQMSEHGSTPKLPPMRWGTYNRLELSVQGLLIFSCPDSEWNEAFNDITTWIKQGKLKYKEDITEGYDNAPKALRSLFVGGNNGKAIIKA